MAAALQAQYSELRAQQPMGAGRRSRSRVVYETLEIAEPAPEQQPPEQQPPPPQTPSQLQPPQPALGQEAAAAAKTDPLAESVPAAAADENPPPDP